MKRTGFKRIPFSFVLAALLLNALAPTPVAPAAAPVLSEAPAAAPVPLAAPPPPGGAFRLPAPPDAAPPSAPQSLGQVKDDAVKPIGPATAASPATPQSPDTCSAPAKIPFGQDKEILMGPMWNYVTTRLDQPPAWGATTRVINEPRAYGNVAVTAWGTDRKVALLKLDSNSGELAHIAWDAGDAGGWGTLYREGIIADGNPVVLSRGDDLAYFVRSGAQIKYRMSNHGNWTAWDNLPDSTTTSQVINDAASDPVVLELDIYHLKLFYRTTAGNVKFTEWESSIGWRTTPLNLASPSGTTIASDLNAVARDENHIAVFGVSANNKLWVKEWSNANQSDWSDTSWVLLMNNVKIVKPAVASRYAGQMGVVVVDNTAYQLYYKEWTYKQYADNLGTPRGWKDTVTVTGWVEPPTLTATSTDEMFISGVNNSGYMYTKRWTQAGGWEAWSAPDSGWAAGQTVAAAVGRPHELMLVGRNANNQLVYKQYTNQNQSLTTTATTNPYYGVLRGQTVATVNGRTVWVSAFRGSGGYWVLAARDTVTWSGWWIALDDPVPSTDTNKVSVAAADLDRDGDDEVVVGTLDNPGSSLTLGVYKLTVSGSTVTAITKAASGLITYGSQRTDVQVAVGDLDADGKPEVAAAALAPGYAAASVSVLEYTGSGLNLRAHEWIAIGAAPIQDLEMAIGQVDSQAGEQIVLAAWGGSGPVYGAEMATFRYDSNTATLSRVYISDDAASGVGGAYSTALATGDIDGDGLDEVIYTYGSSIYAVDLPTSNDSYIHGPRATIGNSDANRSLAVGDVDGDGRAEIVYSTDSGQGASGGWMAIVKQVTPAISRLTGFGNKYVRGVPLLADLDGDSAVATFKRCDEVSDVHVLGVVNSQPVWYQNGQSLQMSGGGMANSSSATNEQEDGWTSSLGGSVSVGVEQDLTFFVKIGEVRASVTQEFMGSSGGGASRQESTTESDGVEFGSQAFGQGAVCYTWASYKCYTYEVAKPGSTITTTAQSCVPGPTTGVALQECRSLESWYMPTFKSAAGSSWVRVGHRPSPTADASVSLNTTGNYPVLTAPPVDPYRVWWAKSRPINVLDEVNPNSVIQKWSVQKSEGTTTMKTGSFCGVR